MKNKQKNIETLLSITATVLGLAGFILCYTAASTEDFRYEALRYNQQELAAECADSTATRNMSIIGGACMLGALGLAVARNRLHDR